MTSPPEVVAAEDVYVSLGGLPILRDINLRVTAGEAVAFMGGNGSGKTVLVKTLLGLFPHQRGTIRLFGTVLEEFRAWTRIGYVPQHSSLAIQQATVQEVVASGRVGHRRAFSLATTEDRRVVAAALERVGLADRVRDPFVHLSGGQQQRVLIARALAVQADLMVLDEPLAGVDIYTQDIIGDVLTDLNANGVTLILVLHECGPFENLLHRAVVLAGGRIISDGALPVGTMGREELPPPTQRPNLVLGALDGRH